MKDIKTDEFVKKVEKLGYKEISTNGPHRKFVADGKKPLSIPRHRVMSPGVQRNLNKVLGV